MSSTHGDLTLPTPFEDGIFRIKNVHTGLLLGLQSESAHDGEAIRIGEPHGTSAQEWILRNQSSSSGEIYLSLQSANKDHGFFAPEHHDTGAKVLYTHKQATLVLVHGANTAYRISDAQSPHLVFGVYSEDEPEIRLFNPDAGDAKQHWAFLPIPVTESTFEMTEKKQNAFSSMWSHIFR